MIIEQAITAQPDLGDAAIADVVNADPSRYAPVKSNAVLEWLGAAGRKVKLDRFAAKVKDSEDPATVVALGAVETVMMAATNGTSFLTLDPSSSQRPLLAGLVGTGVLTAGDADALIAKAKTGEDVTPEQVAAVRASIPRRSAANANNTAVESFASYVRQQSDAYVAGEVDTLPVVPGVPTP